MPFSLVFSLSNKSLSLDIHREARDKGHWPHSEVAFLKLLILPFDFSSSPLAYLALLIQAFIIWTFSFDL
jgi:hypothetical protein